MAKLLDLVGQERWGLPIVLAAAIFGFPPLYAVALLAGDNDAAHLVRAHRARGSAVPLSPGGVRLSRPS